MSQTGDITCPECNTPHLSDDPFCENCGYRLGRPETAFEGYQAIPAEVARRDAARRRKTEPMKGTRDGKRRPTTQPEQVPVAKAGGDTKLEGHPAVKRFQNKETVREHPALEPGTLVEGLSPVGRAAGAARAAIPGAETTKAEEPVTVRNPPFVPEPDDADDLVDDVDDAEASSAKGAPKIVTPSEATVDASGGPGTMLLGIGWIVSVALAVGITLFLTEEEGAPPSEESAEILPVAPKKLKIPGGTFEVGLDEKVRSLILLSCHKMSPSPEDDCDQDDLLGGEFPVREVTIAPFSIDNSEVRVGQYRECVAAGTCTEPVWDDCKVYTHQGYQFALRVPKAMRKDEMPMTCVNRAESAKYCEWAGGRLPSNDEWERAARGDDGWLFPWGNNWAPELANWAEADIYRTPVVGDLDGFASVAPPGQFEDGKSPYGVFDMAGNVAEWVAGSGEGIARGGAWTSQPFDLRVTGRFELEPKTRRTDVGFRCIYE